MITPSQLKEHEFKPAGRNAYKAEDVDAFFAELRADYEKMFRENSELSKRVNSLAETLEKYRKNDGEIKKAVLAAQRASEVIKQEAEASAQDILAEADAVLAAAKSEAQIIKDDASKKAASDSELLMSVTREKVQQIIVKAKKEAEDIVAQARDNAGDQIGVATRTVTKETIHYDMLKKEVTEFKANILAQYKAHIELIQKLPEFALAEALRLNGEDPDAADEECTEQNYEEEAAVKADEIIGSIVPDEDLLFDQDEPVDEAVVTIESAEKKNIEFVIDTGAENETETDTETDNINEAESGLDITFVDSDGSEFSASDDSFDTIEISFENDTENGEPVELTELPFSFEGDSGVEYFSDADDAVENAEFSADGAADYSVDSEADFVTVAAENTSGSDDVSVASDADSFDFESFDVEPSSDGDASQGGQAQELEAEEPKDIPISRPVSFNKEEADKEETEKVPEPVSDTEEKPAEHRKKAFFKRKKNSNNN